MIQKIDGHGRNRSVKNSTKSLNTRVKRGMMEFFFLRESRTITLNLKFSVYTYIPFSDPIIFILRPGLITNNKEGYVSDVCFSVCVFIITVSAILPSY